MEKLLLKWRKLQWLARDGSLVAALPRTCDTVTIAFFTLSELPFARGPACLGALLPMKSAHASPFRSIALAASLSALLLLPGCKTPQKPAEAEQGPAVARQNKNLIGKPLSEALAYYGKQIIHDRTYTATQVPEGIFYSPIRRRFPAGDPASRTALVREVHWQQDQVRMAVFCERKKGQWEVFDTTEWTPEAAF